MSAALLLIDLQNDFLPGGSLAVPEGNAVLPVANAWIEASSFVVATQDWHPSNHGSFASQHPGHGVGDVIDLNGLSQVLWPDHCVRNTFGAEFAADLKTDDIDEVVRKGINPAIDSYSGFFDNGRRHATGLHDLLQSRGITHLNILGLATDYCVKFTVLDALNLGYAVRVIEPGCRGVDLPAGSVSHAWEEMRSTGATIAREEK